MQNQHYLAVSFSSPNDGPFCKRVGRYQSEVEFRPPVCGAWFGEDGYRNGPSQEYHQTLDAVENDLRFLKKIARKLHSDQAWDSVPGNRVVFARRSGLAMRLDGIKATRRRCSWKSAGAVGSGIGRYNNV